MLQIVVRDEDENKHGEGAQHIIETVCILHVFSYNDCDHVIECYVGAFHEVFVVGSHLSYKDRASS